MQTDSPLTVLRRVRELRGLEFNDVADFSGISRKTLARFESGDARPSNPQLNRLSNLYGIASFYLISSAIPNLPPLPVDYRKHVPGPADLSARAQSTLSAYERIGRFSYQLATELKVEFRHPPAPTGEVVRSPSRLARYITRYLADTFDVVLSDLTAAEALQALRLAIEAQGVIVAVNEVPPEDFRGFYVNPDAALPTIFVNRRGDSKRTQLFTLCHEWCHHLLGEEGVSNPFVRRNSVERFCNRFSAELLAPEQSFRSTALEVARDATETHELVVVTSRRTLLSWHAVAIRLFETDFITRDALNEWVRHHRTLTGIEKAVEKAATDAEGDDSPKPRASHAKRISELGYLPVYLAALGVQRKAIDGVDVRVGIALSETQHRLAFALATKRLGAELNQ